MQKKKMHCTVLAGSMQYGSANIRQWRVVAVIRLFVSLQGGRAINSSFSDNHDEACDTRALQLALMFVFLFILQISITSCQRMELLLQMLQLPLVQLRL
jgi:hypothetical protein